MDEIRTGLWTWTAPHPEWHEQPVVRSYAVVIWLEDHRALVFGDSFPGGPIPDDWLPEGRTRDH
jgi:hypothetical protein